MNGSGSGLAAKVVLLCLSVGAIFAVGEIALRLKAQAPASSDPSSQPPTPVSEEFPGLPRLSKADFTRPNVDGIYRGTRFRTNSLGFRGTDITRDKPPGTYRAVIIGDSITMGHGVSNHETYAARIEKIWNTDSEQKYEVLNLGIAGINARASINRLERFGLGFAPDLVIYGFTVNDLEKLPSYRVTVNRFRFQEWAAIQSHLWRELTQRWFNLRNYFYPDSGSYIYELEENYFRNPEVWNEFANDLERLHRLTSERDICLAILLHSAIGDANLLSPFSQFADPVEALATEMGILVIPSRSLFRSYSPSDLRVAFADPHPNALGHDLYAQALLAGIAQLPRSCGFPGL